MSHCKIGFFRWSRLKNHSYNTISSHFTVGVCLTAMHTLTEPQKWFMNFFSLMGQIAQCVASPSWQVLDPLCKCELQVSSSPYFLLFYGDSNSFIDSYFLADAWFLEWAKKYSYVYRNIHVCKEKQMSFERFGFL